MTATAPVTPARGPADPAPGRHAGFAGLLQAEWTKIRSVRSTVSYLPEQAGTLIAHTHEQSGDLLSPWQGFGVLCIWTVLALAAAAYLLERRDA